MDPSPNILGLSSKKPRLIVAYCGAVVVQSGCSSQNNERPLYDAPCGQTVGKAAPTGKVSATLN